MEISELVGHRCRIDRIDVSAGDPSVLPYLPHKVDRWTLVGYPVRAGRHFLKVRWLIGQGRIVELIPWQSVHGVELDEMDGFDQFREEDYGEG